MIVWNFVSEQLLSVILQKYQSRSNQSFKNNSVDILSLNLPLIFLLNLGFVGSLLTVTTQKQTLVVLGLLVLLMLWGFSLYILPSH